MTGKSRSCMKDIIKSQDYLPDKNTDLELSMSTQGIGWVG